MIRHLDHLVLTVKNLEATLQFYENVLGMRVETFGEGRKSLHYGQQKINLHEVGHEFEPKANVPQPGSADLCFIIDCSLDKMMIHLHQLGIQLEEGPVERTGARGKIYSVYVRDPDANLIELSEYLE
ncbi:VOC family protein [Paenibacillus hunanensis]|uniref:VOC family protein n=1 Tax=Paenibacillus hunanensis TaxID=539262 RepID=UPI002027644D|nr:VOC family protein [Paenibacillus hunanensis]MCL9661704.1 VOC family protein [Paenibacillus hunanensis]